MLKLVVRSYSQRSIALLALGITLFFNITFFSKLFTYAASEDNYLILFSAPLVLFLLLMLLLNLVLFPTHRLGFRVMLAFFIVVGTLCAYFIDTYGIVFDSNMYANMAQTDTEEVFDLITPKTSFLRFYGTHARFLGHSKSTYTLSKLYERVISKSRRYCFIIGQHYGNLCKHQQNV